MHFRALFLTGILLVTPITDSMYPGVLATSKSMALSVLQSSAQEHIEHKSVLLLSLLAHRALQHMPRQVRNLPVDSSTRKALLFMDARYNVYKRLGISPMMAHNMESIMCIFGSHVLLATLVGVTREVFFGKRAHSARERRAKIVAAANREVVQEASIWTLLSVTAGQLTKSQATPNNTPRISGIEDRARDLQRTVAAFAALVLVRTCVEEGAHRSAQAYRNYCARLSSRK